MRCLAEHVGEVLLDHHDERSWGTQERGGGLSARRGWEGLPNPDLEVPTKRGEGLPPRWVGASRRALPDRGGLHPLPEGTSWCRRHSRGTARPGSVQFLGVPICPAFGRRGWENSERKQRPEVEGLSPTTGRLLGEASRDPSTREVRTS